MSPRPATTLLLLVGCSAPEGKRDPIAEATTAAVNAQQGCDARLPVAVRRKWFGEARMIERKTEVGVTCSFSDKPLRPLRETFTQQVLFRCTDGMIGGGVNRPWTATDERVESLRRSYLLGSARTVEGISRLAILWSGELRFWPEAGCAVEILWLGAKDESLIGLARELASLNPRER